MMYWHSKLLFNWLLDRTSVRQGRCTPKKGSRLISTRMQSTSFTSSITVPTSLVHEDLQAVGVFSGVVNSLTRDLFWLYLGRQFEVDYVVYRAARSRLCPKFPSILLLRSRSFQHKLILFHKGKRYYTWTRMENSFYHSDPHYPLSHIEANNPTGLSLSAPYPTNRPQLSALDILDRRYVEAIVHIEGLSAWPLSGDRASDN